MKKKLLPFSLVFFFLGLTAFIVLRDKKQPMVLSAIHERSGPTSMLPEWPKVKADANSYFLTLRDNPKDVKAAMALASIYIQEGRVTGDYDYYNTAALRLIDGVLTERPELFDALLLKAVVQLSQHHFTDALQTAGKAAAIQSYNAFLQGVFVDAYVELGDYARAVEHCDKMINIRPDIRSYSRVGYLRELHGDLPGAIEAMKMAVEAGGYGDESTCWARMQLGRLYELSGKRDYAAMQYAITLGERPGYGHALAGQARLAADSGHYDQAIGLVKQARAISSELEYRELLIGFYSASGAGAEGRKELEAMADELVKAGNAGEGAPNHHADKELAWVYNHLGEHEKALKHAKAEYSRRPDNIEVNDLVAWCYYTAGNAAAALPYLKVAERTSYRHPDFLCRASLIYRAAGDNQKAAQLLLDAQKLNPVLDPSLKQRIRKP